MFQSPSNCLLLFALLMLAPAAWSQTGLRGGRIARTDGAAPDVPVVDPDPDFPVRVHLLVAKWGGTTGVYHGYGSGNLLNASGPRGFDYAFECDVPFVANEAPDETYQARSKQPSYELEILTGEAATKHRHTCMLRIALKQRPFERDNTAKMYHGVSSSLRVPWRDPGFAYEPPAPDYPVHFHVLDGARTEDNHGDHGWGTANFSEPTVQTPGGPGLPSADLRGAEFTYDCWRGFLPNTQLSGFYQGHWVQPDKELEVLLQRPGSDKVDKCKVKLNLQPQPYP